MHRRAAHSFFNSCYLHCDSERFGLSDLRNSIFWPCQIILSECSVYKNRLLFDQVKETSTCHLCKFESSNVGLFHFQVLTDVTVNSACRICKLLWLSDVFQVSLIRDSAGLIPRETFCGVVMVKRNIRQTIVV